MHTTQYKVYHVTQTKECMRYVNTISDAWYSIELLSRKDSFSLSYFNVFLDSHHARVHGDGGEVGGEVDDGLLAR